MPLLLLPVGKNINNTTLSTIFSGTFMFLLLLWLAVSLPFVSEAKQSKNLITNVINDDNPLSGTTEEKTPQAPIVSITEEFIHHNDYDFVLQSSQISVAYIHAHESTYVAYHGELLCPPPNLV